MFAATTVRARPAKEASQTLPSFPTELLDLIFSMAKQSTLWNLNLCSKTFSTVARPRIFHTVIIKTLDQLRDIGDTPDDILALVNVLELAFDWDEDFYDHPWAETSSALVDVLPRLTNLRELVLDERFCTSSETPASAPSSKRTPRLAFDPIPPTKRHRDAVSYAYLTPKLLEAVFFHPRLRTLSHSSLAHSQLNLVDEAFDALDEGESRAIYLPFLSYPHHEILQERPRPPPLKLLLGLLYNYNIQPRVIEIPATAYDLEPARTLLTAELPSLDTLRINFGFQEHVPREADENFDLDLPAFFKTVSESNANLRTIYVTEPDTEGHEVVAALGAIPGLEAFVRPETAAALREMNSFEDFSIGLSAPDGEGRRSLLRFRTQEFVAETLRPTAVQPLVEMFPTLEMVDARGNDLAATTSLFADPSLPTLPRHPTQSLPTHPLILLLPSQIHPLIPDLSSIDLPSYCPHHRPSQLSRPLPPPPADLPSLLEVLDDFTHSSGPSTLWRNHNYHSLVASIVSIAEAIPSLSVVQQAVEFAPGEERVFVWDVVRPVEGKVGLVLRTDGKGSDLPRDKAPGGKYGCVCDLEREWSGAEAGAEGGSYDVEEWCDRRGLNRKAAFDSPADFVPKFTLDGFVIREGGEGRKAE